MDVKNRGMILYYMEEFMRRLALMTIMTVSVVALSACGKKENNETTTGQTTTQVETTTQAETTTEEPKTEESSKDEVRNDSEGAVKILDDIWAEYGEDDKFPAAGGDYNEENMRDNAAGKYGIEDTAALNNTFGIAEDDVALIDDAASLMHMMNMNSFTAGAFHVVDKDNAASVAEHIKDSILAKHWMCGFPDELVVYQVDDYIISAYGLTDFIEPFIEKITAVYPDAVELYKENIE